jgi:hypothetical protein
MKALTTILRCVIGCALGSLPGVALYLAGRMEQGIGLTIIGGLLGGILAISSVLYKTSASETFGRGLLLFLKLTAEKNILGGEKLVHLEEKDIPGLRGQSADPAALDQRMFLGMIVGAALAVVPAVFLVLQIRDKKEEPEPLVLAIMKRTIIGGGFIAFVGGGCGAACGSLTIAGVHRRNIVLGTVVGVLIGAGLATAVAPGARMSGWEMYAGFCALFGWLGMVCGLFSGDNFRSAGGRATGE